MLFVTIPCLSSMRCDSMKDAVVSLRMRPLSHHIRTCSVFGEDALVNVSVEKKDDNDGKLAGYIRIRSKTQGIALSLGDRITSVQRGLPDNK